jgi:hypothetical protein
MDAPESPDEIAEVVQCAVKRCNQLLQHGYRLLAVVQTANWSHAKDHPDGGYVHQGPLYILGRPKDVPTYDPSDAEDSGDAT